MKKILMMMIIAAGFLSATAQEETTLVISTGQLRNLDLGRDLNVTLVRADDLQAEVKVATEVFKKLTVSVENGTMYINSRGRIKASDKILVVVSSLESLTVGENTQVNTQGILYNQAMKLFVSHGAKARIVTSGDVNAFSLDDANFTVTKRPFRLTAKLM